MLGIVSKPECPSTGKPGSQGTTAEQPSAAAALTQQLFLFNVALLSGRSMLSQHLRPQGNLFPLAMRLHYNCNTAVLYLADLIQTGVLERSLKVRFLLLCCSSTKYWTNLSIEPVPTEPKTHTY